MQLRLGSGCGGHLASIFWWGWFACGEIQGGAASHHGPPHPSLPPQDAPRYGAVPLSWCPLSPAPTWEVPRGGLGCARGFWGRGIRWREMQEPTLNCFGDKP